VLPIVHPIQRRFLGRFRSLSAIPARDSAALPGVGATLVLQ